jgi:alkylation response protein AidB-like acyl-CoA dehydrogenase
VALRIDEGETALQVEGSVAKLWCTEAGNAAADAAIQALGGYGYSREYMVEKIRRDVRITSIYEGTSEIQQNIIGVFRWKKTVSSKGAFYEELAAACDEAHARRDDCGGAIAAAALRGLGDLVLDAHQSKIIRHQIAQFELADVICRCEIAGAMVRKAVGLAEAGHADAPLFAAASRVFARKAFASVLDAVHLVAAGFAEAGDAAAVAHGCDVAQTIADRLPPAALSGLWTDLSQVGELLKQRD